MEQPAQSNFFLKSSHEKAYIKCVKLLEKQEFSSFKLTNKLSSAGFKQETITKVLTQLVDENLLSDTRYKEARVRGLARKGHSSLMIQQKLKQEGLEAAACDIEKILKDIELDEVLILQKLIDKKWRPPKDGEGTKDLWKHLQKFKQKFVQKGFPYSLVNKEVESYLEENPTYRNKI